MSNASAKAGLRMMALIEGAKGMLILAAGLGLFALAHRDLQSMAEQLVRHLHLNPARHLPRIFLHLAANLSDRRLWLFASAAIIYSTIRFVEAYGLWHDWKWTKWFAVLSGAIYLPAELGAVPYRLSSEELIGFGVKARVPVRIKKLRASRDIQIRLRELGFCEEQLIQLLTSRTTCSCQMCNPRRASSHKSADLILVQPHHALALGPVPAYWQKLL